MVKGLKEIEMKAAQKRKDAALAARLAKGLSLQKGKDKDMTANYDAQDDEDVVF